MTRSMYSSCKKYYLTSTLSQCLTMIMAVYQLNTITATYKTRYLVNRRYYNTSDTSKYHFHA
jgi:hypothetical protein